MVKSSQTGEKVKCRKLASDMMPSGRSCRLNSRPKNVGGQCGFVSQWWSVSLKRELADKCHGSSLNIDELSKDSLILKATR